MLLLSVRVAESPPVWKRAVHPVRLKLMSFVIVKPFSYVSFSFIWFRGWDVVLVVLTPEYCLVINFK